jgi:molybdopterin-guanine dinucleotide biosynthesis protein A
MKILGAILAGGQSRRFGSDKAAALLDGKPLIEHVAAALRAQTHGLLVVGRRWPDLQDRPDLPTHGLGPLGGLAGALDYARSAGFDAVLSSGCDVPGLPPALAGQLAPGPAIVDTLPVVGLWPTDLADILMDWLQDPSHRSVYRFADHINAHRITLATPLANINHAIDLNDPLARTRTGS